MDRNKMDMISFLGILISGFTVSLFLYFLFVYLFLGAEFGLKSYFKKNTLTGQPCQLPSSL